MADFASADSARMFADYVGVSPKWVMRRARLQEAAARADGGEPVDWAALAVDLGYADQARRGQAGLSQQVLEVAFRGRPDPVGDVERAFRYADCARLFSRDHVDLTTENRGQGGSVKARPRLRRG